MRVGLKLKPGDRGTKKEIEQYGDKLLCVRYRYDEKRNKRYKTVELVTETKNWKPRIAGDKKVNIIVKWNEKDLQKSISNAGGRWDKQKKVWVMEYGKARELGLKARIKDD